jgi:long-chain acyl-CoA synthetase
MKPQSHRIDIIPPEAAHTLPDVFRERVKRSPKGCAYRRFDRNDLCCETTTWETTERLAAGWQAALRREGLQAGDRVAVMLRNSLEWVVFDLAAMGLGLVTVPLYANDRPDNFTFILKETDARVLLIEGERQWEQIRESSDRLPQLIRIVSVTPFCETDAHHPQRVDLDRWLPDQADGFAAGDEDPDALASIVYTSGTTGHPKGVMLSHRNILANAYACLERVPVYTDDLFLSFLPLSHTLERTVGYYLPMLAGACVAHVRSLEKLPEDLTAVGPTIIVCVPLIFERMYKRVNARLAAAPAWRRRLFDLTVAVGRRRFLHRQGRAPWSLLFLLWPLLHRWVAAPVLVALGGRIRLAISGGAPLNPEVAGVFNALGLNILQGYGLTEASPVVSTNTREDNRPETVGTPLPGVEVKLGDHQELLVRGPSVMLGYWRESAATQAAIDAEGWLHTGDQASIDADGHITLTGRLKDIIVLSNGEKVPPADLELAIATDPLFDQVMVVGEGRPYLAALVVLNETEWDKLAHGLGRDPQNRDMPAGGIAERALLQRIGAKMAGFPGYARIHRVRASAGSWETRDGALTATLKIRRQVLATHLADEIESLYARP